MGKIKTLYFDHLENQGLTYPLTHAKLFLEGGNTMMDTMYCNVPECRKFGEPQEVPVVSSHHSPDYPETDTCYACGSMMEYEHTTVDDALDALWNTLNKHHKHSLNDYIIEALEAKLQNMKATEAPEIYRDLIDYIGVE